MILTLFNTVGGFSAYNSLVERAGGGDVDDSPEFRSHPILGSALFVMPRLNSGAALISRYRQKGSIVTWIGIYKPLPIGFSIRGGDYCGAGVFISDCLLKGEFVVKLLDELLNDVISDMEQYEPKIWKSQDSYDRSLDRRPVLREVQKNLTKATVFGGLNPSETNACAIEFHKYDRSLGEIVDAAQQSDGFRRFLRLLVIRDAAAAKGLNTSEVTLVDTSGNIDTEPSALPNHEIERRQRGQAKPKQLAPLMPIIWERKSDTRIRNNSNNYNGSTKPLVTKADVALSMVSLSLLLTLGHIGYDFIKLHPKEPGPARPIEKNASSTAVGAGATATNTRLPETLLKATLEDGRLPPSGQFATALEITERLLNNDSIQRDPTSRQQLEELRDVLWQLSTKRLPQQTGPK